MSYINGVLRIIEELIRIVNKLKKLIAKTLLYLNFVESDEFLRLTFYLIWTKDEIECTCICRLNKHHSDSDSVKFAKKKNLERSS